MTDLAKHIDQLFGPLFVSNDNAITHRIGTKPSHWYIPKSRYPSNYYVDINTGVHTLEYALAGFDKDDINISVKGNTLNIEAKFKDAAKQVNPDLYYLHAGVSKTDLSVSYTLREELDTKTIKSTFINNILSIVITPKINQESNAVSIKIS